MQTVVAKEVGAGLVSVVAMVLVQTLVKLGVGALLVAVVDAMVLVQTLVKLGVGALLVAVVAEELGRDLVELEAGAPQVSLGANVRVQTGVALEVGALLVVDRAGVPVCLWVDPVVGVGLVALVVVVVVSSQSLVW